MQQLTQKDFTLQRKVNTHTNERAELISRLVEGINTERIGTKYKPTTPRAIAIKVNKHPMLAQHSKNGELEMIIRECEKVGHYKKFFWLMK